MKDFGCLSPEERREKIKKISEIIRANIKEMSGIENVRGIELANMIHRAANTYDAIFNQSSTEDDISGPRLGILFRLYGDEKIDGGKGVTPTMLSHMQSVTKNTISSLIKGLEDQGLIRRDSDPLDRRIYRLYLTDSGREYIKKHAPLQIEYMNSIVSGLTANEIDQLLKLLEKLQDSLLGNLNFNKLKGHEHFHENLND